MHKFIPALNVEPSLKPPEYLYFFICIEEHDADKG